MQRFRVLRAGFFSLSASATSEPPRNSLSLTVFSSDVILADGGGKSDRQAARKKSEIQTLNGQTQG